MTRLVREPSLWPTAVRQALRLVPRRWWARPPFLPVPSRDYWRFRMETQYGDAHHHADGDDLVAYLRWCRQWEQLHRANVGPE